MGTPMKCEGVVIIINVKLFSLQSGGSACLIILLKVPLAASTILYSTAYYFVF